MSSANPDNQAEDKPRNETEPITQGVADVVNAVFGVGASLAKTVAEATANKPIPAPSPNAPPLNVITHYGLITVGNVFNVFAGGLRNRATATAGSSAGAAQAGQSAAQESKATNNGTAGSAASLPVVQRGATLRIPLSIENPGNEPMQQMNFLCLAMRTSAAGAGVPLDVSAVRFQPDTLSIEPRDFEKLTVFIDTGFDTLPGRYEALLGLGSGNFEMSVQFEVLPQVI